MIETFLACKIVDLIRARIESILAFRIHESIMFIRAFDGTGLGDDIGEGGDAKGFCVDGGGENERGEVGEEGCVCRYGGRVKGGDDEFVEDGGCGFLREACANEVWDRRKREVVGRKLRRKRGGIDGRTRIALSSLADR